MPTRYATFAPARPDAGAFWDAVAAALDGDGLPRRVFVPDAAHVRPCRAGLRRRHARAGRAWVSPWIGTLEQACAQRAPARAARSDVARLFDLHRALGTAADLDADARLALAGRLVGSLDRFEQAVALGALGALDAAGPFAEAPGDEALRTLSALRDALGHPDDPVRLRAAGRAVLADSCRHDALVHWLPLSAAERDWVARAGAVGCVRIVALDVEALADTTPVAAAAWPEAFGRPIGRLRTRAAAVGLQAVPRVIQGTEREDEVQAAAQWICMRRAAGSEAIDVVAPDHRIARRLHALLARAGIPMADAVGTPLSGTVAAAALVRWLDVALADAPHAVLAAWLSSPFVFGDRAASPDCGLDAQGRAAVLEWIDAAAARGRWLGGWQPLLSTPELRRDWRDALDVLARLAAAQREAVTAADHARVMGAALRASGAWQALDDDPTGSRVLDAFERLAEAARRIGRDARLTGAQWRALLVRELDRTLHGTPAAEGSVRRIGIEAAVASGADALIVVGVASTALPAAPEPDPLFDDAVAARLGLPSRAEHIECQLRGFALALALAPHAALTCRQDPVAGSERSAWVERLLAVQAGRTGSEPLVVPARALAQGQAVRLRATPRRGADGPGRGLLPERLSVTDIEQLGACPYRFWAQALLGLREPREPLDAPHRRAGTFVHAVLFEFHRRLAQQPPDEVDARDLLESVTQAQAARQAAGGFVPLLAEWRAIMPRYLDWLAQRDARAWHWQDGEVALDAPFTIGGVQVTVRGRVDRIDAAARDGRPVHAVIDYKVGAAPPHRRRAGDPDEFAQLPLYLLLMRQAGLEPVEAGFLAIDRERVELVPLGHAARGRRTGRSAAPGEVAARWHDRLQRTLERIEAAEPLAALGHQQECGRCAMRGICRRQHWLEESAS